jgi:hypothetical protein
MLLLLLLTEVNHSEPKAAAHAAVASGPKSAVVSRSQWEAKWFDVTSAFKDEFTEASRMSATTGSSGASFSQNTDSPTETIDNALLSSSISSAPINRGYNTSMAVCISNKGRKYPALQKDYQFQ